MTKESIEARYGLGYAKATAFTSSAEGFFVNHSADGGAMTWKGIARKWNGSWQGWQIIDKIIEKYPELKTPYTKAPASISKLNAELNASEELDILTLDFYYENYFKKVCGDKLPVKVGVILFDISVLQGTKRASKTLQRLCNRYFGKNLVIDGVLGQGTLKTVMDVIAEVGMDLVIAELLHEYGDNLLEASKVGNNSVFLNGWLNRVNNLRNFLRLI